MSRSRSASRAPRYRFAPEPAGCAGVEVAAAVPAALAGA
jgi:hypothetical protein